MRMNFCVPFPILVLHDSASGALYRRTCAGGRNLHHAFENTDNYRILPIC